MSEVGVWGKHSREKAAKAEDAGLVWSVSNSKRSLQLGQAMWEKEWWAARPVGANRDPAMHLQGLVGHWEATEGSSKQVDMSVRAEGGESSLAGRLKTEEEESGIWARGNEETVS